MDWTKQKSGGLLAQPDTLHVTYDGFKPGELDDVMHLAHTEAKRWGRMMHELREGSYIIAGSGPFVEPVHPILQADATSIAGVAEGVMWQPVNSALPANFFDYAGVAARIRAFGVLTTGATPGTAIFTLRYGTTTGGTSLGAGTVSGTLVASKTNVPWFLDIGVMSRAIGTSGSLAGFGIWESPQGYTAAPGCVEVGSGAFTTVDTTLTTGGLVADATYSNAGTSSITRKLLIEKQG